ncbi:MAG: glycosyltransferase family 4 protein [Candidatus Uhrbacteria bacterium]|nr:glycosyltransferase family 4 protein [Candidatus Uhrbacteria bacterium]
MIEKDLLLITPDFLPSRGGVARYLGLFAEYFSQRVRVIASPLENATEVAVTYPLDRKPLLSKYIWPKWITSVLLLVREAKSYRCVITSHVIPFGTAAMVAKWFTKKPYIVITHGMDVRLALRSKKSLTSRVLSNAYLVIANSNALAQELQQEFGLKNILTIYPCVDPKFVSSATNVASLVFRLLSVSRLVDRKGHERVLQALALLKMNGSLSTFRYTIVGGGPMRQALETLAIELDLGSSVVFKGDVSDEELRTVYSDADVFVLPVKNDPIDKEGFGMVYLEAAAYGVPSIATRMSGVDEAVLDQETGLLVEDGNIEALAGAILSLANDVLLREQLGNAARMRVTTEFTPAAQFSKLEPYLV